MATSTHKPRPPKAHKKRTPASRKPKATELRIATISQVAKRLKLTPRRIQQFVEEGMPRVTRGKYDVDQVLDWYIAKLESQLAGNDEDGVRYEKEQARDRAAAADLKELKIAIQRRELVAIADVEKEITDLVVTTKAGVLAVPARVAPKLAGLDTLAMQRTLEDELKQSLTKLASRLGKPPEVHA